jgi:hypothetical protein
VLSARVAVLWWGAHKCIYGEATRLGKALFFKKNQKDRREPRDGGEQKDVNRPAVLGALAPASLT